MGKRATAFLLFLALFFLYVYTAAPDVTFHDSGELITGAYTLGIPHPPGSPTWCLLGYVFSRVPVGSPAFRINVMCGFFAALTCVFVYLLVVRMLADQDTGMPRWWTHLAGVLSALLLAQSPAFWQKAVQAEIYSLNACFITVCLYVFALWSGSSEDDTRRQRRLLFLLAALFGLGLGNYLAMLYFVPVFFIAVVWRRPAVLGDYKLLLGGAALLAFTTLAVYLYLPIRSVRNPPIDWENPETLANFISALRRKEWGSLSFNRNSGEFIVHWLGTLNFVEEFGIGSLLLGFVGAIYALRKSKHLTVLIVSCFYMYGVSMMLMQATTSVLNKDLHYVTTYGMGEFHIPLYLLASPFFGIGFFAVVTALRKRSLLRKQKNPIAAMAVAALAIALILPVFPRHFWQCNHRDYCQPYKYGLDLLKDVSQGAWVFPGADNPLFILTYLKFCEQYRTDVSLITPSCSYLDKLDAMASASGGKLTNRDFVELMKSDPPRFLDAVLNQKINTENQPDIYFMKLDEYPNIVQNLYPWGIVYKLGDGSWYKEEEQWTFWSELLCKPAYVLEPDSKPDFREHMADLLEGRGLWHMRHSEFRLAKYLFLQCLRYTQYPRPETWATVGRCLLEEGRLDDAYSCSKMVLQEDPFNDQAWTTLGCVWGHRGRHDLALICFKSILTFDPTNEVARTNVNRALEIIEKQRK